MIYEPQLTLDHFFGWKRRLARETREGTWLFTIDSETTIPLFEAVFGDTKKWDIAIDPEMTGGFAAEFIPTSNGLG